MTERHPDAGPDEDADTAQKSTGQLMRETFDLIDEVVSRIPAEEIDARLGQIYGPTGPGSDPAGVPAEGE